MSQGIVTPVVPLQNDIMLGEGIWYVDYGEVGQAVLGATREGSQINYDRVIKEIKYDGAYGATKGLRRYEVFNASVVINLLKQSYISLGYGVAKTVTDKGTYNETSFNLNIENTDYLTNLTFVGYKLDGKMCLIKLFNVLLDGDISWDYKEKDEIVSDLKYMAHVDPSTPTVMACEIWDYD